MTIIGMDQSYTGFGIAISREGQEAEVFKMAFPMSRYGSDGARLSKVFNTVADILFHEKPELVLMEGYSNASTYGREKAGELGGAVKMAVYRACIDPPLVIPPTTLKKFVTGKGTSPKNVMIQQVYKNWGREFSDDNEADAFSLSVFGQAWLGYGAFTKVQLAAVEDFRKKHDKTK